MREAVARPVAEALGRWDVDLALDAEDAVAGQADARRVGAARGLLGEAQADHGGAGELGHVRDLRAVEAQRGRRLGQAHLPGTRLEQVAAERRLGEGDEVGAAGACRAQPVPHPLEARVDVALEGSGDRGDPRR